MPDPRDIVDIHGLSNPAALPGAAARSGTDSGPATPNPAARNWLGVWFKCCHVYGRMAKQPCGTRYAGRCPKCGAEVGATIGEGGTNRRFFEAS